jgi:hypothetical protein
LEQANIRRALRATNGKIYGEDGAATFRAARGNSMKLLSLAE